MARAWCKGQFEYEDFHPYMRGEKVDMANQPLPESLPETLSQEEIMRRFAVWQEKETHG